MKKKLQSPFSTRQYMRAKDFEIYYYTDYNVEGVKSHEHDYYEFYFFLEGDVEICIQGENYPLLYGDVIVIPPGVKHYPVIHNPKSTYRRFVLWISKEYCNQLLEESMDYVYLMQHVAVNHEYILHNDFITFNTLQSLVFQLIEVLQTEHFGKNAEITLLINTLILKLNRIAYEKNNPKNYSEGQELYIDLCNYISQNLENEITLDLLAKEFFVSKYYISHTFKDKMGISIHQYIMKKRLAACKDAILGQIPISQTYLQFGFRDYSSFFRAFKKEYGISPKEYRNMYTTVAERKE